MSRFDFVMLDAERAEVLGLRVAAGEAGDHEQVAVCDRALAGSVRARRECSRVLREAEAQRAEPDEPRRARREEA